MLKDGTVVETGVAGSGMFGVTLLVRPGPLEEGNLPPSLVLKRQQVLPHETVPCGAYGPWRTIELCKWLAESPDVSWHELSTHFMTCYAARVTTWGAQAHERPFAVKAEWKDMSRRMESEACVELLFDRKESTLKDIWKSLSVRERASALAQLVYAVHVLQRGGWLHDDLNPGNICWTTTAQAETALRVRLPDGKEDFVVVPTYGRLWSLIDYDLAKRPVVQPLLNTDLLRLVQDLALDDVSLMERGWKGEFKIRPPEEIFYDLVTKYPELLKNAAQHAAASYADNKDLTSTLTRFMDEVAREPLRAIQSVRWSPAVAAEPEYRYAFSVRDPVVWDLMQWCTVLDRATLYRTAGIPPELDEGPLLPNDLIKQIKMDLPRGAAALLSRVDVTL